MEAVCAQLQAAMKSLYDKQYKLAIPFRDYPLPQQHLLHQLLEKHQVFAISLEVYDCIKKIDPGDSPLIQE